MNRSSSTASVSTELLKAMSVAARMYYVQEIRQRDIAARLGVSQARVSRLLSQAQEFGVVRTMLRIPEGLHPELEEQIEQGYGVQDVHVVEVPAGNEALPYALGWAAAHFYRWGYSPARSWVSPPGAPHCRRWQAPSMKRFPAPASSTSWRCSETWDRRHSSMQRPGQLSGSPKYWTLSQHSSGHRES